MGDLGIGTAMSYQPLWVQTHSAIFSYPKPVFRLLFYSSLLLRNQRCVLILAVPTIVLALTSALTLGALVFAVDRFFTHPVQM